MSAYASERGQVFLNGIDTDQGKPNLPINSTDVQFNGNVVRWTDVYTSGSVYNGLGIMRNANKFAVASERGFIKKLVASNDNTLLAIHARTMTSLYVGMRMLKSPTGQESIVQSDDVIGYQRPLSTELGTINPESVVSVNNYQVYGFDLNAGEPWRKSNDGVEPLATRYKMKKWFKAKADELKRARAIDPSVVIKIIGAFDPYFQTFFLTFQEVSYVEDSITKIIPAVTIGFSELLKGFVGRFRFTQENYTNLGNSMVSVRNQKLWEHNKDLENHNKFADVQYDSEITIVCKVQDDYEKIWNNIAQSSNMPWSVTKITTPSGQETDMPIENFTQRDGIYYVDILRDKNTPSALLKPGQSPRLHGVEMIGQTCTITLLNSDKKEVILDAIYVGFTPVAGHLLNMK